jgi:DNA-binding GntR family transcriptional regulator
MESAKEKIYRLLKKRIINMNFKPGDALSDRRLATGFSVSRTPVREALTLLQKENYVSQEANRGFFVKGVTLKDIEEMFQVREALEVASLRISALTPNERQLKKLEGMLEKHEKIIKNYKPEGKFLEDANFHKNLALMSGNKFLYKILEGIFERIQIVKQIESVLIERVKIAHEQHNQIVECLSHRMYSKAEKILSHHILDAKDNIINRMKNRLDILHF